MRPFALFSLLSLFAMTSPAEEPYIHSEGYFECKETIYESEFSNWHLVSDMQLIYEAKEESRHWVYQEGRNYKGASQIRWIERESPAEKPRIYGTNAMLPYEKFYSLDYQYQSAGYERTALQVFVDADGVARYQAVWSKEKAKSSDDSPDSEEAPNDSSN